ncbi:MAG: type IV secretion system DNA-binding domain-containing protein [Prosthecobacter sp.]
MMKPHRDPASYPFLWGKYYLSWERCREHFLVMGATGSGKTVLLRRLMQTVLPQIGSSQARGRRALIYDSKKDMRSVLMGMGIPEERIAIMNPFDARSVAWDMAADVQSPQEATELANLLIPKEAESQPFFSNTARSVLRGVIEVFMKNSPGAWSLRHILLACENHEVLRGILESHAPTRWLLGLMQKEQTWIDIKSTLDSYLYRFRFIAAAWHAAQQKGRTISIKQWLSSEKIILLGNDDNARTELDIINRLFFDKLSQLINSQPPSEVQGKQTWLFLDEVREAGKLNTLHSLLLRARSKNCAVVLGFQDIVGMESVYGEKEARELLGCPATIAILHLNPTAQAARKWASEVIDEDEQTEETRGHSRQSAFSDMSTNSQTRWALKRIYNPIEFYLLGRAGSERGMEGIYVVEEHLDLDPKRPTPEEKVVLSNEELFGNPVTGLKPEVEMDRNYIPRANMDLDLLPWQPTDTRELPSIATIFLEAAREARAFDALGSVGQGFGKREQPRQSRPL